MQCAAHLLLQSVEAIVEAKLEQFVHIVVYLEGNFPVHWSLRGDSIHNNMHLNATRYVQKQIAVAPLFPAMEQVMCMTYKLT